MSIEYNNTKEYQKDNKIENKPNREIKKYKDYNETNETNETNRNNEIASVKIEFNSKLLYLEELIHKGIITRSIANKIKAGQFLVKEEILEIFDKIDEIQEIKNIEKYIPEEYIITKKEYIKALTNKVYRIQTITKLDLALSFIAQEITPGSLTGGAIFGSFIAILDHNLKTIQENTIDIKNSLVKITKQKDTRTWWQRFLDFIKELFT